MMITTVFILCFVSAAFSKQSAEYDGAEGMKEVAQHYLQILEKTKVEMESMDATKKVLEVTSKKLVDMVKETDEMIKEQEKGAETLKAAQKKSQGAVENMDQALSSLEDVLTPLMQEVDLMTKRWQTVLEAIQAEEIMWRERAEL